jgi:hypothetical protein
MLAVTSEAPVFSISPHVLFRPHGNARLLQVNALAATAICKTYQRNTQQLAHMQWMSSGKKVKSAKETLEILLWQLAETRSCLRCLVSHIIC